MPEVCKVAIQETDAVSPKPAEAAFYAKSHRIYQELYPALKGICAEIAAL